MRRILALVLALSASTAHASLISSDADVALNGSSVIDFNAEATFNFGSATVDGVTFSVLGSGTLRFAAFDEGGDFGGDGQNLSTRDLGSEGFRMDFASTASAFGMIWGAANINWTVTAYDSSDQVVESHVFPNGPPYDAFFGIAAANMSYVTFVGGSFDWVLVDDLQIVSDNMNPIPLPAGLPLLLVGLAGFGALKRRKAA